jgi:hypothetical protein
VPAAGLQLSTLGVSRGQATAARLVTSLRKFPKMREALRRAPTHSCRARRVGGVTQHIRDADAPLIGDRLDEDASYVPLSASAADTSAAGRLKENVAPGP